MAKSWLLGMIVRIRPGRHDPFFTKVE